MMLIETPGPPLEYSCLLILETSLRYQQRDSSLTGLVGCWFGDGEGSFKRNFRATGQGASSYILFSFHSKVKLQ